nr:glycosyltransferase family 1 protein [Polymorphobacter sp.]
MTPDHPDPGATPPRILIDARWFTTPNGSGIATHGATLLAALPLAGAQPETLTDGGIAHPRHRRWPAAVSLHPRTARETSPHNWRIDDIFRTAQNHFRLTGRTLPLAFPTPPHIAHWTHPLPLHARGARNVYTIHDAIPLLHPDLTAMHGPRHHSLMRAILRRADHLVTVSHTARTDIITALGLDPARITTIHPAGAVFASDPPPHPRFAPGRYFLHLGRLDRRKNLPRLIAAHAASGTRRPLILAGPDGDESTPLAIDGTHVIRLGWLPPAEIAQLLAHARALLLPSLAEGLGLPIIEAMALGTPVLTSTPGATAEIAGNAALLVDPTDTAAIAAGIAHLDSSTQNAAFSVAGKQRAQIFTLQAYADRLATLYRGLTDQQQASA